MKSAYVIGDYFSASCAERIRTVGECLHAASKGLIPFETDTLSFGQGVSLDTAIELRTCLVGTRKISADRVLIPPYFYQKISKEIVHKRYPENVIISELSRRSQDTFSSYLFIDSIPEIVQDHLTGKHLPGMLLLEAARQGTNAVLEARKHSDELPDDLGVAQLSWHTLFNQFAYPLPLSIILKIESSERRKECIEELVIADFFQLGQHIGRINSKYRLLPKQRTAQIEDAMLAYLEKLTGENTCPECRV